MRHVTALLSRELGAYFLSPMAFLVLLAVQLIAFLNFWELVDILIELQCVLSSLRDPMTS
jgi:ABC-2 type transport system permease protein